MMCDESTPVPPRELKQQVVRSLRARGLLTGSPASRLRPVGLLAGAVLVFTLGFGLGRTDAAGPGRGPRFALLLYGEAGRATEAELVARYATWADSLRAVGAMELGEKLADESHSLPAGSADQRSQVGVSGLFILRARDLDGALAIARTCPHLRYGGRVVVRPIVPT